MHIWIGRWLEGQICEKRNMVKRQQLWNVGGRCVGVHCIVLETSLKVWKKNIIKILGSKRATRWQNLNS